MSRTGARGRTSILPPSCMWKVRSSNSTISMPSMPSIAVRTCSWWAVLVQFTTMSSSSVAVFTSKPRRPEMLPPTSPIAIARRPSMPGSLAIRTRMRTEYAGVGVSAIAGQG